MCLLYPGRLVGAPAKETDEDRRNVSRPRILDLSFTDCGPNTRMGGHQIAGRPSPIRQEARHLPWLILWDPLGPRGISGKSMAVVAV